MEQNDMNLEKEYVKKLWMFEKYVIFYGSKALKALKTAERMFERYVIFYGSKASR